MYHGLLVVFFVTRVNSDTEAGSFEVFARNSDSDAWTKKDVFTNKNQFVQFKNYEKNKQYRIIISKQQNKDTMEVKDINFIQHLGRTLGSESFYKVTGTKLLEPAITNAGRFWAVRGWMLGIIEKPSRNYILKLLVTPKGKVTDWNNILRVRDNPQTTSSVSLGDRNPYFGFPPNSYTANVSVQDASGTKNLNSVNGFETDKESAVVIKVIGDKLEVFVDGVSKGSTQALLKNRSSYDNFYVFAGQKHTKAAKVLIKDMQWTNVEVE